MFFWTEIYALLLPKCLSAQASEKMQGLRQPEPSCLTVLFLEARVWWWVLRRYGAACKSLGCCGAVMVSCAFNDQLKAIAAKKACAHPPRYHILHGVDAYYSEGLGFLPGFCWCTAPSQKKGVGFETLKSSIQLRSSMCIVALIAKFTGIAARTGNTWPPENATARPIGWHVPFPPFFFRHAFNSFSMCGLKCQDQILMEMEECSLETKNASLHSIS